jgi:hypothetical protein
MSNFQMDSDDELEYYLISDPSDYVATETVSVLLHDDHHRV